MTSSLYNSGVADILKSLQQPGLWLYLGVRDVFLDHARAVLGVLWPMLGALAWISVIYFFIGSSLEEGNEDYLAYLTIGVVSYNYASGILVNGATAFRRYKGLILNIPTPLFVYPLRISTKVAFSAGLQVIFIITALVICDKTFSMQTLWVIPVTIAYLVTGIFLTLIMGILGLWFGDLSFLMRTIMRLMLFITPIFWYPADNGIRKFASTYNPLAHYMEVLRAPLMGYEANSLSVTFVCFATLAILVTGIVMFSLGRNELARRV